MSLSRTSGWRLEPDFRWLSAAAGILDIVIRCFVTEGIQLPAGCAEIMPCWDAHVSNRKHAGPLDAWIYLILEKTVARSTNHDRQMRMFAKLCRALFPLLQKEDPMLIRPAGL